MYWAFLANKNISRREQITRKEKKIEKEEKKTTK